MTTKRGRGRPPTTIRGKLVAARRRLIACGVLHPNGQRSRWHAQLVELGVAHPLGEAWPPVLELVL
jgi:hypothetical protein